MNNKEFYDYTFTSIEKLLGYYKLGTKQKPSISFQSGVRQGNVKGLEVVVSPSHHTKKRVITSSYVTAHPVQLFQHEGENTIYKAEKKLFNRFRDIGCVDFTSKWVEPDQTQGLLPAVLIVVYFLQEDCCDDSDCEDEF